MTMHLSNSKQSRLSCHMHHLNKMSLVKFAYVQDSAIEATFCAIVQKIFQ